MLHCAAGGGAFFVKPARRQLSFTSGCIRLPVHCENLKNPLDRRTSQRVVEMVL
jgi:hypothetical protein